MEIQTQIMSESFKKERKRKIQDATINKQQVEENNETKKLKRKSKEKNETIHNDEEIKTKKKKSKRQKLNESDLETSKTTEISNEDTTVIEKLPSEDENVVPEKPIEDDAANELDNNEANETEEIKTNETDVNEEKETVVTFNVKEFRQLLTAKKKAHEAIRNFVQVCSKDSATEDYALEYLENGGGTSEFVRILDASENNNASFTLPIIEAMTIVLFKIISSHPQKQSNAEESCRELINKHHSIIKSMLSLNSTTKQRKTALKALSAMVAVSPSVAKEILSQNIFDQSALEILYQPSNLEDGSSVRTHYIYFLISFLIDGHSPTILTFLEKRGFLSSIFGGLMFDTPDIVNLVLTTIQSNILENKSVSKTIKMSLFNTKTIHTFVKLYNWKGPKAWKGTKKWTKPNQDKQEHVPVDRDELELVCQVVQKFLLCLCTTKHGIIFFDPSVGLSHKHYNPLLSTVLNHLDQPWNNKYASELVIKICVTCPDLVKPLYKNLETFLEPRPSTNWLEALRFVEKLIAHLEPSAIEQFLITRNPHQIALIVQQLCIPLSILKHISTGIVHEHSGVRHECVKFLSLMLNSVGKYFKEVKEICNFSNDAQLKSVMEAYLTANLPSGSLLLTDWYNSIIPDALKVTDSDCIKGPELNAHLTILLEVLNQYNILCPSLVENLTNDIDVQDFLFTIDRLSEAQIDDFFTLHIKAINLLISCDVTIFASSKEFFPYAVPLLLKFYYQSSGDLQIEIETMLVTLFKLTGIFDGCTDEIFIWLYSLLDQSDFDENVTVVLTDTLIKTSNEFLKYVNEMTTLKYEFTESSTYNRAIIENLSLDSKEASKIVYSQSKHRHLSPFIFGLLDLMLEKKTSNFQTYLKDALLNLLHYQTAPNELIHIVLQPKFNTIIDTNLNHYYTNWGNNKTLSFKKDFMPSNMIYQMLFLLFANEEFTDIDKIIDFCKNHLVYYTNTIMTNFIMSYYAQKMSNNELTVSFQNKCYTLLLYIINSSDNTNLTYCLNSILDHPILLQSFSPTSEIDTCKNISTEFMINIVKELLKTKSKIDLETHLNPYRSKLVEQICEMLQNNFEQNNVPQTERLMDIIKLLDFSFEHCCEILNALSKLPATSFTSDKNKSTIVLKLFGYTLGHDVNYSNYQPFSNEIMKQISFQLIELNNSDLNIEELLANVCCYIKQFPHTHFNFESNLFTSLITKSISTKSSVHLATILLKNNNNYIEIFLNNLENIFVKRELVFSLVNSVMNLNLTSTKQVLEKVYGEYETIIMKYLNKPQKAANYLVENYHVIIKLITDHLKLKNCQEFCKKSHKFDVTEVHHAEAVTAVFNKSIIAETTEIKQKYVSNYITTSMNLLINSFKRTERSPEDWNKIEKVAKQFCTYIIKIKNVYKIEFNNQKIYSGNVFQTFGKLCLKFGLQEKTIFVNLLKHLCSLTEESDTTELNVLFEMAISHSETLDILLSEDDDRKAPLLSLLLIICKKSPTVMVKSHVPIWLAAYEATLSECDQYLVQLLTLYEAANIGFHEYRPYLWGKAAVGHYSVRSSIETTIWRQPKPKEVLDLLTENRIVNTIQYFPWMRRLKNDSLYSDSNLDVYDPAFYLPLLSHLLAPESNIRWYQCIQRGIISLPIIALTSESEEIRAAACNVLARFHGHLEAASYAKQRFLWLHLIEAVCRGTSVLPSLRPCTIVAVFMARSALVFTRPDHPLYSPLGNYISAKMCPNFNVVPELLQMLHSSDVNHNVHRNFILEVMRDGLCTEEDLKVLYKSVAFKLLMDLYNSVLIDHQGKILILEIVAAAVNIQNGARTLVSSYNLISWLHIVLKFFYKNSTDLLAVFIDVVHNLVVSFDEELFKYLQFNMLLFLVTVIDKFKHSRLEISTLVKFITLLYKVYEKKPNILTKTNLSDLLTMSSPLLNCNICNYYLDFGVDFVETPILSTDDLESCGCYYLKLLTLKWIHANKEQ